MVMEDDLALVVGTYDNIQIMYLRNLHLKAI